jgi:U4/U6.U5 tri-snRNP-associated protein 2
VVGPTRHSGKQRKGATSGKSSSNDNASTNDNKSSATAATQQTSPFLFLSLDLPSSPLFKDSDDGKRIIPQVPLFTLLSKFDGVTSTDVLSAGRVQRKKYRLKELPPYLILHIKRFSKNNWYVEKNPTVVNFPIKHLDMKPYVDPPADASWASLSEAEISKLGAKDLKDLGAKAGAEVESSRERDELVKAVQQQIEAKWGTRYDLLCNVCHDLPDGKDRTANANPITEGSFRAHVKNRGSKAGSADRGGGSWYEIQDLHTRDTIPQLIGLSETYLLVFERVSS